jgi:hypothetical protein
MKSFPNSPGVWWNPRRSYSGPSPAREREGKHAASRPIDLITQRTVTLLYKCLWWLCASFSNESRYKNHMIHQVKKK